MRLSAALLGVIGLVSLNVAAAVDFAAVADTYVQSDAPTTSYGASGIIATAVNRTALIKFDPAAISQATGSTAVLKLKVSTTKSASNAVTIRLVQGVWNESTVTYRTLPALSAPIASRTILATEAGKVVSFDVSAALTAWRSSPATNFGIAVIAAVPVPNMSFISREGGAAPVLTMEGGANNQTTVALSGGNYANPVSAARNAFEGDHWCVNSPCTMNIGPGIFILPETLFLRSDLKVIGSGMDRTSLVAGTGITIAVETNASVLSDLSIVNNQNIFQALGVSVGSGTNVNITPALTRVSVLATGQRFATGLALNNPSFLTDVKVVAHAEEYGVGVVYTHAPVVFTGSSVEATGANMSNVGIERNLGAAASPLSITNSVVTAAGGQSSVGIDFSTDASGSITGSTINATSAGEAKALFVQGGVGKQLTVTNSDVNAIGGYGYEGAGLWSTASGLRVAFDDVRLHGKTVGVTNRGASGALQLTVKRSRITAQSDAFQLLSMGDALDISDSVIRASMWLEQASGTVHATDSILDGWPDYGQGFATCARVYGMNYQFFPGSCPPKQNY